MYVRKGMMKSISLLHITLCKHFALVFHRVLSFLCRTITQHRSKTPYTLRIS